MALKKCCNCGKEFITEADIFVYQNRPSGEYYSCGCVEFKKHKEYKKGFIDGFKAHQRNMIYSGCACILDDTGEILQVCEAHEIWKRSSHKE